MSDDTVYTAQIEDTGTYTYIGEAGPGTPTTAASWRIARVTNSSGKTEYASSGAFKAIWDNRASITYS